MHSIVYMTSFHKNKLTLFIIFSMILGLILYKQYLVNHSWNSTIVSYINFSVFLIFFGGLLLFSIQNKFVIAGNIVGIGFLYTLLELACFILLGKPDIPQKDYKSSADNPDPIIRAVGWGAWADSVLRDTKINGTDTVFDIHYSTDKYHNRITPLNADDSVKKTKYALFFGCSVTYGWGIEDNQTLPYYFQKNSESYHSYNYAYSGWGTQQMLVRLQHEDIQSRVKEKEGIAVYVFVWSHIQRVIGDFTTFTEWGWTWPYFEIERDTLVDKGNFAENRKFVSGIYRILYHSYVNRYFKLNFPINTTDYHLRLTAEIIKQSADEYSRQFHNDNFYVLIHPGWGWEDFGRKNEATFLKMLNERKIKYFNVSDSIPTSVPYIIPGDGHPTPLSNNKTSMMLIKELHIEKVEKFISL